jgi:hypothetical protein
VAARRLPNRRTALFCSAKNWFKFFSVVEKQSLLLEKNAQKKSRRFSSETLSFLFRIVVEVN